MKNTFHTTGRRIFLKMLCGELAIIALCTVASTSATSQSVNRSLNSISGTVTVLDEDGRVIPDASNVVVFIDGISEQYQPEIGIDVPKISHRGRQFSPHVLPIVKGTTIDFLNDDSIYHNVFSLSEANTFDLGIYPEGTSKLVTFEQPGLVNVYCNIHPNMVSTILVLNNTMFVTTGADGAFEIRNIPDGQFTLRVWYEFGEELSREVSLSGGNQLTEAFTLTAIRRIRTHDNKFGRPYREKY